MGDFMTKVLRPVLQACFPPRMTMEGLYNSKSVGQNPNHRNLCLPRLPRLSVKIKSSPPLRSLNPDRSEPIIFGSGYGSDNDGNNGSGSNNNRGGGGGGGGDGGSDCADDRSKRPIGFIFLLSPLVVGSILNFVSMPSYIFEPGNDAFSSRFATSITFAAFGFAAGLVGAALWNGLIKLRKKPNTLMTAVMWAHMGLSCYLSYQTWNGLMKLRKKPKKTPPTFLNAVIWAAHMGLSRDLRWNGVEYVMGQVLPPAGFKFWVVGLRRLKDVIGGVSFLLLARLTGYQKVQKKKKRMIEEMVTSFYERWSKWGLFSQLYGVYCDRSFFSALV